MKKRTGWRIKIGSRVAARNDLREYDAEHVQGGEWEWLEGKPYLVRKGFLGTVVAVPDARCQYSAQHSSGHLTVSWDHGITKSACRYDLEPA